MSKYDFGKAELPLVYTLPLDQMKIGESFCLSYDDLGIDGEKILLRRAAKLGLNLVSKKSKEAVCFWAIEPEKTDLLKLMSTGQEIASSDLRKKLGSKFDITEVFQLVLSGHIIERIEATPSRGRPKKFYRLAEKNEGDNPAE